MSADDDIDPDGPSGVDRRRALIVAAIAVVVAVVIGVVMVAARDDTPSTAEAGSSSTSSSGGDTTSTTGEPIGPTLRTEWTGVRTDGTQLTIAFLGLAPTTDPDDPCQSDYEASFEETGDGVTLALHGNHVDTCPTDITFGRTVTVDLAEPLADRPLVNGATQTEAVVFDGDRVPEATWLPDGWEQLLDVPVDPRSGVVAWQVGWGPPRSSGTTCGADVSPITLTVGSGSELMAQSWVTSFATVGTTTVGGEPAEQARLQAGPVERPTNETMLRWSVGEEGYVLRSAPACVGEDPADFTLLQRIADGLS